MLNQFLGAKITFPKKLFLCLQKVDHVTNYCKRPIIHYFDPFLLTHQFRLSCNQRKDWGVSLGPPHSEHTCNSLKTLRI